MDDIFDKVSVNIYEIKGIEYKKRSYNTIPNMEIRNRRYFKPQQKTGTTHCKSSRFFEFVTKSKRASL
jgi:hypothetical protein